MELEIEEIACVRAGRPVFSGFSARLAAGEAAELRGPNGAGKSSLLRLLAGLVPPAGGRATLGGIPLGDGGFQEHVLLCGHLDAVKPALSVRANLAHWAAVYGAAAPAADAALERFGLGPVAAHPAAHCSAGQKRRLGLARLMVIDRPLWLLDEPTVSLDGDSAALVTELIAAHLARGGLAVVATHLPLGLPARRWELDGAPAIPGSGAADPFLEGAWS